MDRNLSKLWEIVKNREAWHAVLHGVTVSRTQLSYWTATTVTSVKLHLHLGDSIHLAKLKLYALKQLISPPPLLATTILLSVSMNWTTLSTNGNPLQYSCLENPRDGGAWWAAVYGVAQSRTRLKRLSSSSSKYLLEVESYSICLFVAGLSPLAQCPQVSSIQT